MSEEPKCCRNCKHWNAPPETRERGYDAECEMTIYYGTAKHPGTTAFGKSDAPYYPPASLLTRPDHFCSMHTPLDGEDLADIQRKKRLEDLTLWLAKFTQIREEFLSSPLEPSLPFFWATVGNLEDTILDIRRDIAKAGGTP